MKKGLLLIFGVVNGTFFSQAQDALLHENRGMVFTRTPAASNRPGNASQSFNGDDYIYGRVFFNQTLKEALLLEKNAYGNVPVDIYVEDLTNNQSLYISFGLKEDELNKTYFDFDILPDTARIFRAGKEFETGRFSNFLREESLEKRHPVYKFTVRDATGYIWVDFSFTNLQQVKARDRAAYEKSKRAKEGEETQ